MLAALSTPTPWGKYVWGSRRGEGAKTLEISRICLNYCKMTVFPACKVAGIGRDAILMLVRCDSHHEGFSFRSTRTSVIYSSLFSKGEEIGREKIMYLSGNERVPSNDLWYHLSSGRAKPPHILYDAPMNKPELRETSIFSGPGSARDVVGQKHVTKEQCLNKVAVTMCDPADKQEMGSPYLLQSRKDQCKPPS